MAITVVTGDLTAQEVDAIVNAANEHLVHGGGVALAIVRTGGPVIQEESTRWVRVHGPLRRGEAAVTTGGSLRARWVIHVVGPRYRKGQDNDGLLAEAVVAALDKGAELHARSIALPAISAGIFGFPPARAGRVIARTVATWQVTNPTAYDEILLVAHDPVIADAFADGLTD